MSRQSLLVPVGVLLIGLLLIGQMLVRPNPRSNAQTTTQTSTQATTQPTTQPTATDYPAPTTQPSTVAYPIATRPSGNNQRPTATGIAQSTRTPIPTLVTTPIPAPPQPTVAAPPTDTPPPSATPAPTNTPTITPTPTPTPDPNRLSCAPGRDIVITGSGPANAGVLIRFAGRVVGGGSIESTGQFALTLVIGREEPGSHRVTVEVRGTRQVLRSVICDVPIYSITATPASRQTPTPTATFER